MDNKSRMKLQLDDVVASIEWRARRLKDIEDAYDKYEEINDIIEFINEMESTIKDMGIAQIVTTMRKLKE